MPRNVTVIKILQNPCFLAMHMIGYWILEYIAIPRNMTVIKIPQKPRNTTIPARDILQYRAISEISQTPQQPRNIMIPARNILQYRAISQLLRNPQKTALSGHAYDWVLDIGIYCNTAEYDSY